MLVLTKENILSYINKNIPSIRFEEPVEIAQIGAGDLPKEVEGDGYCNFVFRLSDQTHSCIIKQSTPTLRRRGKTLTPERNRYECEIMELRAKYVPQYVPKLYYQDFDNHILVMEDVSNLRLIRFALSKGEVLPDLARQGAEYLAATHFYTSEFYMETAAFRYQLAHFMNAELRTVMENGIFLNIFAADDYDPDCGPAFKKYCESIRYDEKLQYQRYKLRHLFMSKSETLIHGDFHTSNIFADQDTLKVIDHEYTFGAPLSYDLGFITANIISQISAATYRPYMIESKRNQYIAYLISLIESLYNYYIHYFFAYWDKDAKIEYKLLPDYKEVIALDLLRECFGFAACVNFSRVMGNMETEEYDSIKDPTLRTKTKFLSAEIDKRLFENWSSYQSIKDPINDIIEITNKYKIL